MCRELRLLLLAMSLTAKSDFTCDFLFKIMYHLVILTSETVLRKLESTLWKPVYFRGCYLIRDFCKFLLSNQLSHFWSKFSLCFLFLFFFHYQFLQPIVFDLIEITWVQTVQMNTLLLFVLVVHGSKTMRNISCVHHMPVRFSDQSKRGRMSLWIRKRWHPSNKSQEA